MESGPPRLLDRVPDAIRMRHYSRRTEVAYVTWIRRYIVFHRKAHPARLERPISAFLTWLQELLGHKDVSTTMVYTHVLNRGALAVKSPADRLLVVGGDR